MKSLKIDRFTTRFSSRMNRIALISENSDGNDFIVLLNSKLLSQLVIKVCDWLQSSVPMKNCHSDRLKSSLKRQAFNEMAQTQARVKKIENPQNPIKENSSALCISPNQIRLRFQNKTVLLIFKDCEADIEVVLGLIDEHARQWLDILYRHCVLAEWDSSIWPDWITNRSLSGSSRLNIKH